MTTLLALLRGINLGSHNRVGMAELRGLVAGLGYQSVRTHLQSGNVLFDSDDDAASAARCIEDGIAAHFALRVPVVIRDHDELAAVVAGSPLRDGEFDPARFIVTFLSREPDPRGLDGLDAGGFEPDRYWPAGRQIYSLHPEGVSKAKLDYRTWERRLGVVGTARNWKTVTRLLELMEE